MTNENHFTIGIYGIQDSNNSDIPSISHDHGICIIQNGKILFNLQLERLNRKKHSDAMPDMIYDLLKEKKILGKACNFIFVDNILGRSFINRQGNIRFEAPLAKTLSNGLEEGKLWWLNKSTTAFALNHELAHLGSCLPFFGAFKNNSLLIHFDGGASLSNFSAWKFSNNELSKIEAHWNFKKLSSLFNANALTFAMVQAKALDLNSVPGKFMGFASFGNYNIQIEEWLEENDYFEHIWASKKPFYDATKSRFGIELNSIDQKDPFIQNIAATIHHIFVRDVFNKIKNLQQTTGASSLYYSGGSALNIVLNTKIIESEIFKDVFIPPCCNDAGLALGAASFFEWSNNNLKTSNDAFLNNWNIEDYRVNYDFSDIKQTAELLLKKKVIGVCNEQAEIGPRALGNRSILSLASSKELAAKVSMFHKKREWYRPVAPIMLEKNTRYFTGLKSIHHLSEFMLLDFNILDDKKQELEGAVHIDGTSRIQTIFSRTQNPFIYDLLKYLNDHHQVKALINTSFNIKGEPIVHTIEDAKKSALNMQLDAVVINGKLEILMHKH